MKTFLLFLFAFLIATEAEAQRITASVTVTNLTTNGMTFTVNGNVRTWTNQVFNSGSQILTNADVTGSGSKTNLFNQIALNQFSQTILSDTGSNTFNLVGAANAALVVTASAGYASVSYSTQAVSTAVVVRIPVSIEQPAVRTNIESGLVTALNDSANTNSLNQNATVASQLVGTTNTQTITGQKNFSNTNGFFGGLVTSLALSGNSVLLSNGLYLTPILLNPILTNGVNYSNAFSSRGIGSGAEQFGFGAIATNDGTTAVGALAIAGGETSTAVGYGAHALLDGDTAFGVGALAANGSGAAFGQSAIATNGSSTAVGVSALAGANSASAFGTGSTSMFANSTAIGSAAITTAANQVMLGAPGSSVVVPNGLTVQTNFAVNGNARIFGLQTNATYTGTNNFPPGSDIAFGRFSVSSLANGNNAAVPIGTNVFIELSGPSAAFTVNGIAGGRDGKDITLLNQTGFQMTIANESGTDPTAANRIRTLGPGADLVFTNAAVGLRYNANVSRWIVISHNP